MTSNTFPSPRRNMIDLPVAALAGIAVAFAAFTIPADILGEAVGATGLGSVFPAAQPPLGGTARLAMAVAGALTAFAGAFMLLRWLDRFASRPAERIPVAAPVVEAGPRVHRADAHPDAPPRRPISAARDLGEPAPPRSPADWLDDLQPPAAPKPVAASIAALVKAPPVPAAKMSSPVPVAQTLPPQVAAARVTPPSSPSLTDLMARLEHGLAKRNGAEAAIAAAPPPESAPSPEPVQAPPMASDPEPIIVPEPEPEPVPSPEAAAAPQPEPRPESIAEPAPEAPPLAAANDRLQEAIESLQRLAARN